MGSVSHSWNSMRLIKSQKKWREFSRLFFLVSDSVIAIVGEHNSRDRKVDSFSIFIFSPNILFCRIIDEDDVDNS